MHMQTLSCKRLIILLFLLFSLPLYAASNTITFKVQIDPGDLVYKQVEVPGEGSFDLVEIPGDYHPAGDPGEPFLPSRVIHLAVPPGSKLVAINTINIEREVLPGEYNIFPAQKPVPTSKEYDEFFPLSQNIAQLSQPYPVMNIETLTDQAFMRGYHFFAFRFYPLHFTGSKQQLTLITEAEFEVVYEKGIYQVNQYRYGSELFDDAARRLAYNPEDLGFYRSTSTMDYGDAEYLIITTNSLASAFQPLANWKTQKGYYAQIVTVENITSAYSGSDTQAKIKNCIIDYVNNHGTIFVLLGGDNTVVPDRDCYCVVNGGDPPDDDPDYYIPTDLYYSSLDGSNATNWNQNGDSEHCETSGDGTDLYADVIVTRAGLRTAAHVTAFVNKSINYEKSPATSSFGKAMLVSGVLLWSSIGSISDAEAKTNRLLNNYVNPYWSPSYTRLFDTTPGVTLTVSTLSSHLNSGYGHFHMATHGRPQEWSMESGDDFLSSDALALTNANEQGIIVTIACLSNGFDYNSSDPCLSEAYLRNPNGGAVAYFGSSRYGWGTAYTDEHGASFLYDDEFYRRLLQDGVYRYGQLVMETKLNKAGESSSYGTMRWEQLSINPMGDPELNIYTENPLTLSVSHPSEVNLGNEFTVTSTPSGAKVCCWMESASYYAVETTPFTFTAPASLGEILVTVTKQNYIPYEGTIDVVNFNAPEPPEDLSPFDNARMGDGATSTTPTLSWAVPVDPSGDNLHFRVQWDTDAGFGSPTTIESRLNSTGFTPRPPVAEGTGTVSYLVNSQSEGAMTNGTTYWWRVSAWDGAYYGNWSEKASLTINTSLSEVDWYQTTDDQFERGTLNSTQTDGSGRVRLNAGTSEVISVSESCADGTYINGQNYEFYSKWTVPGSGTVSVTHLWILDGDGSISSGETIYLAMYTDGGGYSKIAGSDATLHGTGSSGWLSGAVTTPFNITLGNTYWIGVACASGTEYVIYRDENANCSGYPPTGTGSYYASTDHSLNSSVPTSADQSGNKYIIGGITYLSLTTSGTAISQAIDFDDAEGGYDWGQLKFSDDESGGDIKYTIQYWTGSSWANTSIVNQDNSPVDISGLDPATHNIIRISSAFTWTSGTPYLNDWTITWSYAPPNFPPVVSAVTDGGGWHREDVTFTYTLEDEEGENCTVTCDWYDGSWHSTTSIAGDGVGTPTAPGTGKTLTWHSGGDYTGESSAIQFRITPHDGTQYGTAGTDTNVDVDNKAPELSAAGVSGTWDCLSVDDITLNGTDNGSGFQTGCPRYNWDSAPANCSQGQGYTHGTHPGTLPADDHTLYLYGIDAVGNVATQDYLSRQDCEAPTTPGTPTTVSPTCDDTPTWTWTASDDDISGLPATNAYRVYWSTTAGGEDYSAWVDALPTPYYTHTTPLAPGTWYCKVVAYDNAGNSDVSRNGSVEIQESPGSITFNSIDKTTTSLTWNWNAATSVDNYEVNFDGLGWSDVGSDLSYAEFGLGVNTEHSLNVRGVNSCGAGPEMGENYQYTYANVPGDPICLTVDENSVSVQIVPNGNPAYTEYAIYCNEEGQYVQLDGSLAGAADWQRIADWRTVVVGDLVCGAEYSFKVKARNGDYEETEWSRNVSVSTFRCNSLPVVTEVTDSGGWHGGNVTFYYTLVDADTHNCTVTCEWYDGAWHSTDNVWGDGVSGPASPGSNRIVIWASGLDYVGESSDLQFRLTPNDGRGDGTPGTDEDVDIDNKAPTLTATGLGTTWDCRGNNDVTLYGVDGGSGFETDCPRYSWTSLPGDCRAGVGYTDESHPLSIPNGVNTIYLYGSDAVGNEGTQVYENWQDCTSPTQPGSPRTDTPTCDDTPTWTWTASVDYLSGIPAENAYQVFWSTTMGGEDYSAWADASPSPSYTHAAPLAAGRWFCKVVAYDEAGNPSTSENGTVEVLESPGDIGFIAPGKTTTSITWNWAPVSGATAYEVSVEMGGWTYIGDETFYTRDGLSVNDQYYLNVRAINSSCNGPESGDNYLYTYANVPGAPLCEVAGANAISVDPVLGDNPAYTELSVFCNEEAQYVQSDGSLGAGADWNTDAEWGTVIATGLDCATSYNFVVRARNGDGDETGWSREGTATTAACGNLPPEAPTLFNLGSADQLCFNNAYVTDQSYEPGIQLRFRTSAVDPDSPADQVQYYLQINSASNWSGTDLYNGLLNGIHASGITVDKLITCTADPAIGGTYYVRMRARDPYGSGTYGPWTTSVWSFTYKETGKPEWHQTADTQFETDVLLQTGTTGSGSVQLSGSGGDIVFDSLISGSGGSASSLHGVISIGGEDNRAVVVTSATEGDDATEFIITDVTFNGVSMTEAVSHAVGTGYRASAEIWYMLEDDMPGAGTYDVYIYYTGSVRGYAVGVFYLHNVKQEAPEATNYSDDSESGASNITTSITTITDNAWLVDVVSSGNTVSFSPSTTGQVERWELAGTSMEGATSTKQVSNAGTTSMGWNTSGSNRMSHCVAAFAPASSPNGNVVSTAIYFGFVNGASDWAELNFTDNETNGDIKYNIQYWDGAAWVNTPITGNDTSPVDISSLDPAVHNPIRLYSDFTYSAGTPYLNDWTVQWEVEEGPLGIWNIGEMQVSQLASMETFEAIAVANNSDDPLDYGLRVTPPEGWVPVIYPAAEIDCFSLRSVIQPTGSAVDSSTFEPVRDYITGVIRWGDEEVFGGGGYNVRVGETRNIWFQFASPIAASSYGFKTFLVTLESRVHLP